jgi:hypothetical protein
MLTLRKEQMEIFPGAATHRLEGDILVHRSPFMLTVSKEQMEIFRKEAMRHFEDEMLAHLGEFSPPLFKVLGKEQMRKAIRFGIALAGNHGFTFRGPIRLYLELMLLFGSHFDTDPQYPWAAEILANQDAGSQMQRAEWLYEKTMDYRHKVAGPEDAYALQALRKITTFLHQPIALPNARLVPAILQEITSLYPQKAAYVGREGLEALIRKSIHGAARQRLFKVRGVMLVVLLMLAFGHGCGYDPLYPWIANTLKDEASADHEVRTKRLEGKALSWIEYILAYFDKEMKA